jgi:hypothetical protein
MSLFNILQSASFFELCLLKISVFNKAANLKRQFYEKIEWAILPWRTETKNNLKFLAILKIFILRIRRLRLSTKKA